MSRKNREAIKAANMLLKANRDGKAERIGSLATPPCSEIEEALSYAEDLEEMGINYSMEDRYIILLGQEVRILRTALADAIRRPMGVIPASAEGQALYGVVCKLQEMESRIKAQNVKVMSEGASEK